MAFTRKFLAALGIEADKVDEIIEAHMETVNALKVDKDAFKASEEKVAELQKQLNTANEALKASGEDEFKTKYEALVKEYEGFKESTKAAELNNIKDSEYRKILKECGVSEKRMDAIMKLTNLKELELEDGKLKDIDKIKESVKNDWGDFIVSTSTSGASTETPPITAGGAIDLNSLNIADYIKARTAMKSK